MPLSELPALLRLRLRALAEGGRTQPPAPSVTYGELQAQLQGVSRVSSHTGEALAGQAGQADCPGFRFCGSRGSAGRGGRRCTPKCWTHDDVHANTDGNNIGEGSLPLKSNNRARGALCGAESASESGRERPKERTHIGWGKDPKEAGQ